jgi:hypothetical protein
MSSERQSAEQGMTNTPANFGSADLGFLYVISHANAPGMIKIGITQRPTARMEELGAQVIWARVLCFEPRRHEQRLHAKYGDRRLPGTEWFRMEPGREQLQGDPEFSDLLDEVYSLGEEVLSLCIHHPNKGMPEYLEYVEDLNHRQRIAAAAEEGIKRAALEEVDRLRQQVELLKRQLAELHFLRPR